MHSKGCVLYRKLTGLRGTVGRPLKGPPAARADTALFNFAAPRVPAGVVAGSFLAEEGGLMLGFDPDGFVPSTSGDVFFMLV